MAIDPRIEKGVELFNTQQYFEAHEALEAVWLASTDEEIKPFLKGLIQAAVALYHHTQDNINGAHKVGRTALGYLAPYEPHCLGLDVRRLRQSLLVYLGLEAPSQNASRAHVSTPSMSPA